MANDHCDHEPSDVHPNSVYGASSFHVVWCSRCGAKQENGFWLLPVDNARLRQRIAELEEGLGDTADEMNDALCELLHQGNEPGIHTPEAHLKLHYRKQTHRPREGE